MKPQLRTAVSVLLTPDPASRSVVLVERNPKLRYFGGYTAFVGGTLDPGDGTVDDLDVALRRAAVREVLEETGVLLGTDSAAAGVGVGGVELAEARRRLLAGEPLDAVVPAAAVARGAATLRPLCRIVTPPFAPVRFATDFYWAVLPPAAQPEIWPGELVAGGIADAGDALARWRRGEVLLAPPVVLILEALARSSVATLADAAAALDESRQGDEIRRILFSPGVQLLPVLTRTRPPATHTNVFLVGERRLWLVDPAPAEASEQERLWRAVDRRLADGAELAGIVLSHHHPDHVGGLSAARERYGVPVLAHPETLSRLEAGGPSRPLGDGEVLPLGEAPDGTGDWELAALHTPGHAPGHLALRESRYGAVLAGDLVSTLSTIVIDPPEGHMATYLRSLERLRAVADGVLYPSHGPPVRDGHGALDRLLAHRRGREEKLVAALGAEAQSVGQLLPRVYDDVDAAALPLAERSLRAGLQKLVEEGRCEETMGGFRRPDDLH